MRRRPGVCVIWKKKRLLQFFLQFNAPLLLLVIDKEKNVNQRNLILTDSAQYGRLRDLEKMAEVDSCMGLANIEAMDGYILTQQLSPRAFAELIDMIRLSRMAFASTIPMS